MIEMAFVVAAFTLGADGLVAGPVELVADGFRFTEGPVWTTQGELIFSDIPADTVYRADKSVLFRPSGKTNGMTLDAQGRLIRCEHDNRRVVRVDRAGAITVLADAYLGKKLNSPNDVVCAADGTVYFTDPPYGLEGREQEQDANAVYAIRPGGEIVRVAGDFNRPNGIALSPDARVLYVADTEGGEHGGHIRAFRIASDGSATGGEELCEVPTPDGIRVDTEGRIWASSTRGVVVFSAEGKELEAVAIPQVATNCGFGGADGMTLFVTAQTGVYRVRTHTTGIVGGWKR